LGVPNDIATLENWQKLPTADGGDEHLTPLNMWPMGKARPEKITQDQTPPGKALDLPGNVIQLPAPERSAENA
jgi:hypothetical protein